MQFYFVWFLAVAEPLLKVMQLCKNRPNMQEAFFYARCTHATGVWPGAELASFLYKWQLVGPAKVVAGCKRKIRESQGTLLAHRRSVLSLFLSSFLVLSLPLPLSLSLSFPCFLFPSLRRLLIPSFSSQGY